MNWQDLKRQGIKDIGGAVSGGLDSCTVTHWLSDRGFKLHCFTVDLGQPDEKHPDSVTERMLESGAISAEILSGKEALADAGLKVIQAQAKYEGGYWNTTGIARPITVSKIIPELNRRGINVLFHGATGRGNDQVRFQLASNMLDPNISVYAPWRDQEFVDQFPGRKQMIDYCQANGLPIKSKKEARYSTDANFLGLTHEAGDLEDVGVSPSFVNPIMGVSPWDSPETPENIIVSWHEGTPVAINGEVLSLTDIFHLSNEIAGRNGIGIGTHVIENRFVGVKSRGIYEAPAMEMLGQCYEFMLQFILDRRAREFLNTLSGVISTQIYQGYWYDVATTAALAALDQISQLVTGTIELKLNKGQVYFESVKDSLDTMPCSLYTEDSSMESVGSFDHVDSEGLLRVLGVSAKNIGIRQLPKMGRKPD